MQSKIKNLLNTTKQNLATGAKALGVLAANPWLRRFVYIFFIVQAVYLVFMVPIGIPPDELAHIRRIEQYMQQDHWLPMLTEQTMYSLGEITRSTDYFYHYALSLLGRVMPFDGLALYVVFRLVSVATVLLTFIVSARLMKRLGVSEAVTTIGLLIVSNIAQVLFISIAINQDLVVMLATAAGALFLVRLWQKMSFVDTLALANIILFASISKKTFLPIAVLFGLILIALLIWKHKDLVNLTKEAFKKQRVAVAILGVLALIGIGLNVERFGYNIVKYQQISVSCDKIHTHEQCMEHGVYRRNANLTERKPDEFTPIPITEFAPYWYYHNFRGVFGTQGWNGRAMPSDWAYHAMLAVTSVSLLLGIAYSARHLRRPESLIFIASLGYIAVQLAVNYNVYLSYATQGLALQGRYIFPIIVPLVLVLAYMWYRVLKSRPIILAIIAIFTVGLILTQSGLSVIIRSNLYTTTPLQPVILFDPKNAISGYEPGV